MFACKFAVFCESRLWECRVLQCFRTAVYGNVVFLRCLLTRVWCFNLIFIRLSESCLWECCVVSFKNVRASETSRVFPGKGVGPGFSLCCRPLALDRTLLEWARRIFLYAFLRVFLKMRSLLYAFLRGLLNPAYGNVVFSRSKLHAFHKSLAFFPFTFVPAPRKSHDARVILRIFVWFFA